MNDKKRNTVQFFTGCGESLKNKGDFGMLQGIYQFLSGRLGDSNFVLNSLNPPAFRDEIPYQVVWSPENYFITRVNPHRDSKNTGRLYAYLTSLWIWTNYVIFRVAGRCLIQDAAVRGYFSSLQHSQAVLVTGGGYLNSVWWLDGLYSKVCIAVVAKLAKVPVVLTSQGLGPYTHPLDKLAASILFRIADFVGVRDADESGGLVRSLAGKARYFHTGDDALLLNNSGSDEILQLQHDWKIPVAKTLVGVNLRDSSAYSEKHPEPVYDWYAEFLDKIIESHQAHLVFVPVSYNEADGDAASAEIIYGKMKNKKQVTIINKELQPYEIKSLISIMDYSIGISYHFLLFSLSQRVPSLGIYQNEYYKNKLSGLFKLYGVMDNFINFHEHDVHSALKKFMLITEQKKIISATLGEHGDELAGIGNDSHESMIKIIKNHA